MTRHPFRISRSLLAPTLALAPILVLSAFPPQVSSQAMEQTSEDHRFRLVEVATGLQNPWGAAFLPGGDVLLTERSGSVRLVRGGRLLPDPIQGGPQAEPGGQGGLLDVSLHPDFEANRLVYFSYSKPVDGGRTTAVARARFDGERFHDLEDVFIARAATGGGAHFGSRIVFDREGHMFVTVGDRGQMDEAQNLANHQGTHIRLHDDGRVPDDNPFVGRPDALPEIFAYGNRNPQGMIVHAETGSVLSVEHGPRGGDELNHIRPGLNYGWPAITHGINYDGSVLTPDTARAGMEQPLVHWTPSIAVSGLTQYTGERFPSWKGDLFAGALGGQHIRRIVLGQGYEVVHQEILLEGLQERVRQIRDAPDGYLYLLTEPAQGRGAAAQGRLLRLEPI